MLREFRACSSRTIRKRRFAVASVGGVPLDLLELLGRQLVALTVASLLSYGHSW